MVSHSECFYCSFTFATLRQASSSSYLYCSKLWTILQSGCCKPPTSCTYSGGMPVGAQDEDCYRWNNAPNILCYQCDSCKAGVMEQVRQDWHTISVLNVIVLVILICICSCGCCAFRNARRSVSEYPYGVNRMSKIHPRWDYHWYSQQNIFVNSFDSFFFIRRLFSSS